MTSKQRKEDLAKRGRDLECELNRLTEQAELAVLQADPATYFLQTANQRSSTPSM